MLGMARDQYALSQALKLMVFSSTFLLLSCAPASLPKRTDLAPLPASTRSGVQITSKKDDLGQRAWWKKINDPVLNHLIIQALTHNNQINVAKANIIQAQAQLKAAHNAWLPTLGAAANGFAAQGWRSNFKPQGALAQSRVLADEGNVRTHGQYNGFVPEYSLNILANQSNSALAKASLGIQEGAYQATRLNIISQVCGSYFSLLGQKQQLIDQQTLIKDLKK